MIHRLDGRQRHQDHIRLRIAASFGSPLAELLTLGEGRHTTLNAIGRDPHRHRFVTFFQLYEARRGYIGRCLLRP